MNQSVAEQFVILALNPEKGRITISDTYFIYTLTGALIMEYFESGEIKIENKRIIPSFRKNGEDLHDTIADRITKSSKNRRISFWIGRLSNKSRYNLREITNSLAKKNIIRIEQHKFLNIIPYKRYWFVDTRIRTNLIQELRGILLYDKKPGKNEAMLLGLIESSRAYSILAWEKGEIKILRKKNLELLKGNLVSEEISQTIREVQSSITASIIAAAVAAGAGR
jgi:hypothetical protein